MKRRSVPFALAGTGVIALILAGCSDAPAAVPAAASDALSIQFVNPLPSYPSWRVIGDCMAEAAEARGVEFTESGPTGQGLDPTSMIEQTQQAIAGKKSGIITFPASDAFGPVLTQARDAGIVTATIYGSGTPESGADINVGVDFGEVGALFVEAVKTLPGEKKLGLIAAGNTGIGGSWIEGVKTAVAQTDDIEVVGEVYTGDDSSQALTQTNALLTAQPDINVIITHMGTVTQGAVTALETKGLTGDVAFVGIGPDNGGKEALESGAAYRLLMQGVCDAGTAAVDNVVDRLESGEPAGGDTTFVEVGTKMASVDEITELLDQGWL